MEALEKGLRQFVALEGRAGLHVQRSEEAMQAAVEAFFGLDVISPPSAGSNEATLYHRCVVSLSVRQLAHLAQHFDDCHAAFTFYHDHRALFERCQPTDEEITRGRLPRDLCRTHRDLFRRTADVCVALDRAITDCP